MKLTIAVATAALMAACVHDRAQRLTADTAVTTPSGASRACSVAMEPRAVRLPILLGVGRSARTTPESSGG
jgi:hypothetical protein